MASTVRTTWRAPACRVRGAGIRRRFTRIQFVHLQSTVADGEGGGGRNVKSSGKKGSLTRTAAAMAAKKDKQLPLRAKISKFLFGWLDTKVKVGM